MGTAMQLARMEVNTETVAQDKLEYEGKTFLGKAYHERPKLQ